ncbi:hypothetical protein BPAE_0280g00070 [Botrytis paeoniae]|uniref:DNA2/NAM7 helicase helicase domain-containing protein n=1 Tax=Botrytis paeoniae TaxID=278948 RepID=A0A4Z1FAU1_9HELO|nr:hypothetical protein BPAE_0280g00070 [Botrytis paeoniae]
MLKRKAGAEAAESGAGLGTSSNAKKAKEGSLSENFPKEPLAEPLDSWHIKGARGRDFPKFKQAKSILKGIKQGAPILVPAKMRPVLAGQAPGLLIILQGGRQIKLSAIHFTRNPSDGNWPSNDTGDLVETYVFARESKIWKDTIEKSYNIDLRGEDFSSMNDVFSVATESLYLMEFGLKGRLWFEQTLELPSNKDELTETQVLQRNFERRICHPATPPSTTLKVQFIPKAAGSKQKKLFDESLITEGYDVEHNSGVAYSMKRLTIKNKGKGKQRGQNDGEGKTTPAAGEPAVDPATAIVDTDAMEIEDPTPAEASKNKDQAKNKGNGNKWQKQQAKVKPAKKEPVFPMYSCRIIELANSPGDLCIAVKIADRGLDASFVVGSEIEVCIIMTRNAIPQIRQMKAIGSICKQPAVHNVKHAMLQNWLLGDDIYTGKDTPAQSVQDDHFSRMKDVEKQAFNDFRDACNFNGPQRDFLQDVFGTTKFMNMLQGPSETGKITTVASVTLGFALLRIKTLLNAPSNTAAQE